MKLSKNVALGIAGIEAVIIVSLSVGFFTSLKLSKKPMGSINQNVTHTIPQGFSLTWPINGTVVQKPSWYRRAIDITNNGTDMSVKAAEKGIVQIADCSDTQKGCSIIIDHGNNFFTEYIHMKENRVKTGDLVEKGQTIASMGKTLTFSFYYDEKVMMNPFQYLPQ